MTSHLPQRHALKRQFLWVPVKKMSARLLKQRCSKAVEMSNVAKFST